MSGMQVKGIWSDGISVFLAGSEFSIYEDGKLKSAPATNAWYDFKELSGFIENAKDVKWRISVVDEASSVFEKWNLKTCVPDDISALVMATWVQSLWDFCPQVFISGGASTGKSLLARTIAGIFGNLSQQLCDLTFAGFRQAAKSSACVMILDEFDCERNSYREHAEIVRAIRLRNSQLRGTHNKALSHEDFSRIVWMFGIQQPIFDDFILIELGQQAEKAEKAEIHDPEYLRLLGQKILAIAIVCSLDAVRMAASLKNKKYKGVSKQTVEANSVLAAMLSCAIGCDESVGSSLLEQRISSLFVA